MKSRILCDHDKKKYYCHYGEDNQYVFEKYNLWWYSWYFKRKIFKNKNKSIKIFIEVSFFGFLLYLIGLGISFIWDFPSLYLKVSSSWPIIAGIIGICFFLISIEIFVPKYIKEIKGFAPIFEAKPGIYSNHLNNVIDRAFKQKWNLIWAIGFIIVYFGFGDYLWLRQDLVIKYPLLKIVNFMPDQEWYQTPVVPKLLISNILGLFIVPIISITTRMAIILWKFFKKIGKLKLISNYSLMASILKFRFITNLHFQIALAYSVGVWLIVFVWVRTESLIAYCSITLFAIITGSIIIIPYYYFMRIISKSKKELVDNIIYLCLRDREIIGESSIMRIENRLHLLTKMEKYNRILRSATETPKWIYEIRLALASALSQGMISFLILKLFN